MDFTLPVVFGNVGHFKTVGGHLNKVLPQDANFTDRCLAMHGEMRHCTKCGTGFCLKGDQGITGLIKLFLQFSIIVLKLSS